MVTRAIGMKRLYSHTFLGVCLGLLGFGLVVFRGYSVQIEWVGAVTA